MEPKRFLLCSLDAALVTDLAWQVHREGHEVKYYIEAERDREIGDGFVPKTDDWRDEVDWADVIVFDDIWVTGASPDVGIGVLAQTSASGGTRSSAAPRTPTAWRRTAGTRWTCWKRTA